MNRQRTRTYKQDQALFKAWDTRPPSRSLLAGLSHLPLLVIATMRPGPLPAWMAEGNGEMVALDRLDAASTRALARAVAAPQALSAAVEDAVVARSDGVPLFAEELTRACLQGEALATASPSTPATTRTQALLARLRTWRAPLTARASRCCRTHRPRPTAASPRPWSNRCWRGWTVTPTAASWRRSPRCWAARSPSSC